MLGSDTYLLSPFLVNNRTPPPHIRCRRGSRGGGGRWGGRPPLGRKDPRRSRGFPRLKGRKQGHWCLLNGVSCSTLFRHNMAINILKSCKSVFAYVKKRSFPSHIRSSFPWRPSLAEILDPRLRCERTPPPSPTTNLSYPGTRLRVSPDEADGRYIK